MYVVELLFLLLNDIFTINVVHYQVVEVCNVRKSLVQYGKNPPNVLI